MPAFGEAMQQPNRPPRVGAGAVKTEVNAVDLKHDVFKLIHVHLH
jgi:hypothetical protein